VDIKLSSFAEDSRHAGNQLLAILHRRIHGSLLFWSFAFAAL
jgi:hypothetical protein